MLGIMETRLAALTWAYHGLSCHEPALTLRRIQDCSVLSPRAFGILGDDPGIYIAIPRLAHLLDVDVGVAMRIFVIGIAAAACTIGMVAWFKLLPTPRTRAISAGVMLFLFVVALYASDVYTTSLAIAVAASPWLIIVGERMSSTRDLGRWSIVILVLCGLGAGAADIFRAFSGTTVLIFAFLLISLAKMPFKVKAFALAAFLAGFVIPKLAIYSVVERRDAYLAHYMPTVSPDAHPLWHSVYVGLSFSFPSSELLGPPKDQTVAAAVASATNKPVVYLSEPYERVARDLVFKFIRQHPAAFVQNLAAKTGVVTLWLFVFVVPGLWLIRFIPRSELIAFAGAVGFGILPGFVSLPQLAYCVGGIGFAATFSLYALGAAGRRPASAQSSRPLTSWFER